MRDHLRQAVRVALINVLEEEVEAVIGAQRYERTEKRRDQRNGHYTRTLDTSMGPMTDLPVPRTRHGHQTHVFERYHRRREEMDQAISGMFVGGVSTKGVGNVMETLTGTHPSPSTVSRVFHTLQSEYMTWKTRSLAEQYAYAAGRWNLFHGHLQWARLQDAHSGSSRNYDDGRTRGAWF